VPDDLRGFLARSWRIFLCVALGAFFCVALATMLGHAAAARAFGTLAWATAFVGAISGLVAGGGFDEGAER
jgi:Na+-transporting NADH:ubiquinone oxidoreductase subunit NqrB